METTIVEGRKRPDCFNFATDSFDRWAAERPQKEAMFWVSQDLSHRRSMTYEYFSRQSHRVAVLLQQLRVHSGEVMVMVLYRVPAW